MDVFAGLSRSQLMSRIRGEGNKRTELRLIGIFREHGFTGWRRRQKLVGKPDFVFRMQRVCVFVDGCFWHGCPKCYRRPSTNQEFWDAKRDRNIARDVEVTKALKKKGWRVMRIWEHDLRKKNEKRLAARLRRVLG